MRIMTKQEVEAWVEQRSLPLTFGPLPENAGWQSFVFPGLVPARSLRVISQFAEFYEDHELVLWLTDWDIFAYDLEQNICRIFRAGLGVHVPLLESRAYLFEPSEIWDAFSFFAVCATLTYDAFLFPGNGKSWMQTNHHDELTLSSMQPEAKALAEETWISIRDAGGFRNE